MSAVAFTLGSAIPLLAGGHAPIGLHTNSAKAKQSCSTAVGSRLMFGGFVDAWGQLFGGVVGAADASGSGAQKMLWIFGGKYIVAFPSFV